MINKEFIIKDGAIYKDFIDRSIPQYANNQVCVSVLIPSGVFVGNTDYSVILAVGYRVQSGSAITTLNTLVMSASKSITIDGVLYVKYSAILSYDYTQNIGQLLFSPYIRKIIHTQGEYDSESQTYEDVALITNQDSYTYTLLNVIKSVLPQYDASLEDSQVVDTLNGKIEAKKIYTFIDTDSVRVGQHYYNLVNDYNPNADQFNGCLVISVYGGWTNAYIPYLNNGNVELLEIIETGMFYKISNVAYSNSTYTFTRTKLSYTKDEVDTLFYEKTETYNKTETDNLLNTKVDKTTKVNGHALSGDITLDKSDVGLGNVANYGVESATPSASGDQLYITSKAVYDYCQLIYSALNGYATTGDLSAINTRLESVEAIIGSDEGDADNVINTLKEVIVVLNGLGEGANLLDLINAKANQTDLTALDNQINATNGIKDKVDILSERNNAYMEIKNSLGTIDILVGDWDDNADINYPYKWELTNGYLEGAVNCIVVYSKDSDTSMISATTGIDEENGKLIIYASELPSATISIEKIAVFNDLNSYINYSNEIVQQVLTNTSAISDINNVKLPTYVKKEIIRDDYRTFVKNNNYEENGSQYVDVSLQAVEISDANNFTNCGVGATLTGAFLSTTKIEEGVVATHTLKLDTDGILTLDDKTIPTERLFKTTTDATESGGVYTLDVSEITGIEANDYLLYINSGVATTLYQVASISSGTATLNVVASFGGGGKQLYQHNIAYRDTTNQILLNLQFTINAPITSISDLKTWLSDNGYTSTSNLFYLNGGNYKGNTAYALYLDNTTIKIGYCANNGYSITYVNLNDSANISNRPL